MKAGLFGMSQLAFHHQIQQQLRGSSRLFTLRRFFRGVVQIHSPRPFKTILFSFAAVLLDPF